jgi:hypothetical protein
MHIRTEFLYIYFNLKCNCFLLQGVSFLISLNVAYISHEIVHSLGHSLSAALLRETSKRHPVFGVILYRTTTENWPAVSASSRGMCYVASGYSYRQMTGLRSDFPLNKRKVAEGRDRGVTLHAVFFNCAAEKSCYREWNLTKCVQL